MSTKPICMCSTLNFGLLDNHCNPRGVGIVFLCKPGSGNLNFRLCVLETLLFGSTHKYGTYIVSLGT